MSKPNPPTSSPRGMRRLWMPKRTELKEPCASCPFRQGNDDEFGEVVNRLRKANGMGKLPFHIPEGRRVLDDVRLSLEREVEEHGGEFVCHQTAYRLDDDDMKMRDEAAWRQCAGAARHYRGDG